MNEYNFDCIIASINEFVSFSNWFDFDFWCFNATFNNISVISWRPVLAVVEAGEPPTMGKHLVNFITCGCESSAPFFVIYKAGRESFSN